MKCLPLMSSIEHPSLVHLLRWRAQQQPAHLAYRFLPKGEDEELTITYGQLDIQARAIASQLQQVCQNGQRALLLYTPGLHYIAALLGCLYANVVAVPAYPPRSHALDRFQSILTDAQIAVVLSTESDYASVLRNAGPSLHLEELHWVITDYVHLKEGMAAAWQEQEVTGDTVAFLQYTSGSTLTPRGVILTHSNLLANLRLIQQHFEHTSASHGVVWLPPYHDMGLIGGLLQPLYCGFPVTTMSPTAFLQRPLRWLQAISKYRATTSGGPNFAYDLCVSKIPPAQRVGLDLSSWDVAFTGAEQIRAETLERFVDAFAPYGFRREAFYPCYGLAEATLLASGGSKAAPPVVLSVQRGALEDHRLAIVSTEAPEEERELVKLVGCGSSLYGQSIVITDPQSGYRCPDGRIGEVWLAGASVAQGYYNQPDATLKTFQAYLADTGAGPFLRTGDLGVMWKHELFITGRLKDLIIIRGRNHYPQDIERSVADSHPALQADSGAAFTVHEQGEEVLVIAQEIQRRHRRANFDEVIEAIRKAVIERHELHVAAVLLLQPGTIPKTSSGKIQRNATRERFLREELATLAAWRASSTPGQRSAAVVAEMQPGQDIAAWLTAQVATLLNVAPDDIAWDQPLIRYGLDSLQAIELLYAIETATGWVGSPADLLAGISLASLAQQVQVSPGHQPEKMKSVARAIAGDQPIPYALAPGQQGLWFLEQLAPGTPLHTITAAAHLVGPLDVTALQWSLNELAHRHEAIRTTFSIRDGVPVQIIAPSLTLPLQHVDLRNYPAHERLPHAKRLAKAEARHPFDLNRGPLFRVCLQRLDEQEYILLLVMHHMISDGQSIAIIAHELVSLYQAFVSGAPSPLPELPVQYVDFVGWQQDQLVGDVLDEQVSYWKGQLSGLVALQLPTDHPRPAVQSHHGALQEITIPRDLAIELAAFCRREEVTLYMLLLTTFQLLLQRYSDQDDIVVGTPIAGRPRAELNGVMGFFVNTLVMRTDLSGDPTVRELLRRVRDVALGASSHASLPFEQLVEQLNPRRDLSRQPLFQAMLVLQKDPASALSLPAVAVTPMQIDTGTSVCDLTLTLMESDAGLRGAIEYATDLFDAATIARLSQHFLHALQEVIAHPQQRLSTLSVLTEVEREQLLVAWNATERTYRGACCIHELFEEQAARSPEAIAIAFEGQELSYRELNGRANQLAHVLRKMGVAPEVRVGLCMERSPDLLVALLGILKAGGAYVPLDPAYPAERLSFMLADAQIAVLLTQEHLRASLPTYTGRLFCVDSDWQAEVSQASQENLGNWASEENLAYVIYTSGSTGRPKGVLVTHKNLVSSTLARVQYYKEVVGSFLLLSSIAFDSAVAGIFWTLTQGGTLVLPSEEASRDLLLLTRVIEQRRVTHMLCVPSFYAIILAHAHMQQLASLRVSIVAGESCPRKLVAQHHTLLPGTALFNEYGPTECSVWSSVYQCQAGDEQARVPIGRPIANAQLYVLDRHLQPTPIGVPGELYIGGGGVARGYLGHPDLTGERFVPNPFGASASRLYKTGDLVRYRSDGNLEFLGRLDQQMKLRGYRIEPGEIEAALKEYPAVREAVVTIRETAFEGAQLVAYLVARQGVLPATQDLRAFLRRWLPDYMVPSVFWLLETLPLTPNGKIDQRALSMLAMPHSTQQAALTPTQPTKYTPIEKQLLEIWADILGLERVSLGLHDNFFDLGGHSLLATQLMFRVSATFGVAVSLASLFEQPTIAGMASMLNLANRSTSSEVPPRAHMLDLRAEAFLDPAIKPGGGLVEDKVEPRSIYLTGATGFLGSFILSELLRQTSADIYCLVRAGSVEAGREKLRRTLEGYSLWNEDFSARIVPLAGDLAQPLFGLPAQQFAVLASTIDAVYHSGALVNFTYPYSQLKAANVLGTQEILRFASHTKVKPVHYISTTSVYSSPHRGSDVIIREQDAIDDYASDFANGYARSKWVAEKLVSTAGERGLPVCIYRPGLVAGHSQVGTSPVNDFLSSIIKGCIQLGAAPAIDVDIHMTPVDYVSQAIVALAKRPASLGSAFHLVNSHQTVNVEDLVGWINTLGYSVRIVSYSSWREKLWHAVRQGEDNALLPFLSLFMSTERDDTLLARTGKMHFDDRNTRNALEGTGIACPPIDLALFSTYIAYFVRTQFLHGTPVDHYEKIQP